MDTKRAGFFAAVIVPALVTLGLLNSADPNQAADSDSQKRAAESGALGTVFAARYLSFGGTTGRT